MPKQPTRAWVSVKGRSRSEALKVGSAAAKPMSGVPNYSSAVCRHWFVACGYEPGARQNGSARSTSESAVIDYPFGSSKPPFAASSPESGLHQKEFASTDSPAGLRTARSARSSSQPEATDSDLGVASSVFVV
jgi:hypothetical protein